MVYFLLRNGLDQVVVLFICYQARDMLDYLLYGLHSILVRFLGYPVEVVYQIYFDVLMGLSFYAILVSNLQDFVVGSSGHGCSMKKLGVPLAREFLLAGTAHPIPGSSGSPPISAPHCSPPKCRFPGAFSFFLQFCSSLGLYFQKCPCSTP
jgi:hypothetical protein